MRRTTIRTPGLPAAAASLLLATTVHAADLNGSWTSDRSQCKRIFLKTRNQILFSPLSDQFGGGFIINGKTMRGKYARCTIKNRQDDGDTVNLVASCSTDLMLQSVHFSLKVGSDGTLVRQFPGMSGLEQTYYRCSE